MTTHTNTPLASLALALAVAACSPSVPGDDVQSADATRSDAPNAPDANTTPVQGSCDLRSTNMLCIDHVSRYDPSTLATAQGTCAGSGGVWSTTACPHTGALGGCRVAVPGVTDIIQWAYAGSLQRFQSGCTAGGGTYLAP